MNRAYSAKGLIRANQHPYQRPVSHIKRTFLQSSKNAQSRCAARELTQTYELTSALRNFQRIKQQKGYTMTTTSFEGVNNVSPNIKTTQSSTSYLRLLSAKNSYSTAPVSKKRVEKLAPPMLDHSWLDNQPNFIDISAGVLSRTSKQSKALVAPPNDA